MRILIGFARLQAIILAIAYPIAGAWGLATGYHVAAALVTAGGLFWTATYLRELHDQEETAERRD